MMKGVAGMKFNRLTILRVYMSDKWGGSRAFCEYRCDCGKRGDASLNSLKTNNTKSCGCLKIESTIKRLTTEHYMWKRIKARCMNKEEPSFRDYGGSRKYKNYTVLPKEGCCLELKYPKFECSGGTR